MNRDEELPTELRALLPPPLHAAAQPAALERGQALFGQGARPAALFYVVRGEVVLERAGRQGQTVVLQRVRRGFVAEASMQSSRYHCSGLATLAGQAFRLPMAPLKVALQQDSRFAVRWIGMLNDEVRRLRAQTERLTLKGVKARLLHLIETEGRAGRLEIGSGLKSLSAQLGVTHEALYRTVAAMEQQGMLVRKDGMLLLR
jgi:CRP/FNR family transcriptional regulator, dissimilatory nitrate respiration regulator